MTKKDNKRENLIDEYTDLTNKTAEMYNESFRNLSNALLTAASIYMAVIAAIIASKDSIASIPFRQVILIGLSILSFLISIIFGIISHMDNVSVSKKMYKIYKEIAEALTKSDAIMKRSAALKKYQKVAESRKDKIISIIQLVFFTIGAILLIFPLYTILFNNWAF